MLRIRPALTLLLLLTLAAAPMPALAGPGGGPLAPPDQLGPWAVGRTTIILVDPSRGDRTVPVDVWYPVDAADASGPASIYDLVFAGIESEVALQSPPPSSGGPFPLVVFSHGSNGLRYQSYFLMEHLASHGFFVASPEHLGNSAFDLLFPGTPFEARDRPLDVSLVITTLLDGSATPGDPLEGRIDPERIGVAGHSFGGFTALAMATGFEDVPPDPRVRAIIPMSPASGALTDAELSSILLPTLFVGGTADTTTPIDPATTRPWSLVPARPRYRVDVVNAGHASFTDICIFGEVLIDAGLPPFILEFLLGNLEEGCAPELIDIERAQYLTNLYATAFLKRNLEGDPRYSRYLTPATAKKLGDVIWFRVPGCTSGAGLAAFAPMALFVGLRGRSVRRTR